MGFWTIFEKNVQSLKPSCFKVASVDDGRRAGREK
jgi:hypothetical protein